MTGQPCQLVLAMRMRFVIGHSNPSTSSEQAIRNPDFVIHIMPKLDGLKIVSFESRRLAEMAELIRKQGGEPVSAPSMREVPLSENDAARAFAEELLAGKIDAVVFFTGVGF